MSRYSPVILTILGLMISVNLYSQNTVVPSSVLGIRQSTFFNILGSYPHTEETIIALSLPTFLRIKRHEWYAGLVFPMYIPATWGEYYLSKRTIGASTGYRYYIFDPQHRTNLFFQYEFQYIYFSGQVEEGSNTGFSYYNTKYEYLRNIFGLGFSLFFDKRQNVGISFGCGYIIPCDYYKESGSNRYSYSDSDKWGDPYMNNYINFNFDISIKLASFQKDKN